MYVITVEYIAESADSKLFKSITYTPTIVYISFCPLLRIRFTLSGL